MKYFIRYLFLLFLLKNISVAQNSYLPIDTVCVNCMVSKEFSDSIIQYYFNSDSNVVQVRVNYKLKRNQLSNRKILLVNRGKLKPLSHTISKGRKRIIRKSNTKKYSYCNKESIERYNKYKKIKQINKKWMNGEWVVESEIWKKTKIICRKNPLG